MKIEHMSYVLYYVQIVIFVFNICYLQLCIGKIDEMNIQRRNALLSLTLFLRAMWNLRFEYFKSTFEQRFNSVFLECKKSIYGG